MGSGPFDIETGEAAAEKHPRIHIPIFFLRYSVILHSKMIQICAAITAAMADGTGLARFARIFPNRFFDVGIAEETWRYICSRTGSRGIEAGICGVFLLSAEGV